MKAHELFTSSHTWCKESPAEDSQGNKLEALNARAVKWCALGAIPESLLSLAMERSHGRTITRIKRLRRRIGANEPIRQGLS